MMSQNAYNILGIGHACIDLLIPINEEFLQQIEGEKGGAQEIGIEELYRILSLLQIPPHLATGGSCANTIKGLAGLGERCGFLSRIGSDSLGEHFAQYMKKMGIMGLFSKSENPTAQVLCLITPDGQRTMRFYAGCSEEMTGLFLDSDDFKGVKLVHLDAYNLFNEDLVEHTMRLAKEVHANISIDLSSFEIVHRFHHTLIDLLTHYVNIVFANKDEAKALTGYDDPLEGCLALQKMCPVAVVLMGNQGCLVGHQGEVIHSPSFPAHVVDTTGAGDLFASGFLYGYMQGYSLAKCASLGNRLGSAIVEVQGAELSRERLQALKKL